MARDFVHLGEITHGSGSGVHQLKNKPTTRDNKTRR